MGLQVDGTANTKNSGLSSRAAALQIFACALPALAITLPVYFFAPSTQQDYFLPDVLPLMSIPGVLVFAGFAGLCGLLMKLSTAAIPACILTFVPVRLGLDVLHDPTSHNLWPFEIGFILVFVFLPMWIATYAGRKLSHAPKADPPPATLP